MTLLSALAHAQTPATSNVSAPKAVTSTATDDAQGTVQAAAAATSTTTVKTDVPPSIKYKLDLGTWYTVQAEVQKDQPKPEDNGTRKESLNYSFNPGLSYGDYKASVLEIYSQDLKDTSKTGSWIDPSFSFSRASFELNKYFKLGPAISLTLPLTDKSRNDVELLYSLGGSLSFFLQTKALGLDAWDMAYYVAYARHFTKYATSNSGDVLNIQRIRQRINVGYNFTEKWALKTRFEFDSNYSAEGIVRNKFLHYQTINYKVNDTVSLSVGHTNSGDLLNGTNYESNLKFYDDAKSEYSAELDVSL